MWLLGLGVENAAHTAFQGNVLKVFIILCYNCYFRIQKEPEMKVKENVKDYIHSFFFSDCPVLNTNQKIVVIKRVIDKLTYTEIAKSLERSNTQAKNIFERSIYILELFLKEFGPDSLIQDTLIDTRTKKALQNINTIKYLRDLNKFPYSILISQRNLGVKSIERLQKYISVLGYSLSYNTITGE